MWGNPSLFCIKSVAYPVYNAMVVGVARCGKLRGGDRNQNQNNKKEQKGQRQLVTNFLPSNNPR